MRPEIRRATTAAELPTAILSEHAAPLTGRQPPIDEVIDGTEKLIASLEERAAAPHLTRRPIFVALSVHQTTRVAVRCRRQQDKVETVVRIESQVGDEEGRRTVQHVFARRGKITTEVDVDARGQ